MEKAVILKNPEQSGFFSIDLFNFGYLEDSGLAVEAGLFLATKLDFARLAGVNGVVFAHLSAFTGKNHTTALADDN